MIQRHISLHLISFHFKSKFEKRIRGHDIGGELTRPNLKTDYKATVIRMVWCW